MYSYHDYFMQFVEAYQFSAVAAAFVCTALSHLAVKIQESATPLGC